MAKTICRYEPPPAQFDGEIVLPRRYEGRFTDHTAEYLYSAEGEEEMKDKARERYDEANPKPEGLYEKYLVKKLEGPTDQKAFYFVLRLDTDEAARAAAMIYADLISETDPLLSADLITKLQELGRRDGDTD